MFLGRKVVSTSGLFGAFLAATAASAAVPGGGIINNGGDRHASVYDSAWFVGDRPISYCIEVNPEFGVPSDALRATIEGVFKNWGAYLRAHRIAGLTTAVSFKGGCDGSQDLAFYFGVDSQSTEIYRKVFYDNPVGFAQRTTYEIPAQWGKGFIWIANTSPSSDWTQPGKLFGILSHEVGHALGCEHVNGTIMDQDIADILFKENRPAEYFARVDWQNELAYCSTCAIDSATDLDGMNSNQHAIWGKLLGRPPRIGGRVSLVRPYADTSDKFESFTLIYSDREGTESFPVHLTNFWKEIIVNEATVFKIAPTDGGPINPLQSHVNASGYGFGHIQAANGTPINLMLSYNESSESPWTINHIDDDGEEVDLFPAD